MAKYIRPDRQKSVRSKWVLSDFCATLCTAANGHDQWLVDVAPTLSFDCGNGYSAPTPTLAAEISTLEFQCNSYFPTQNGPVDRVPGFLPLSGGGPWWLQASGGRPFLLIVRLFLRTHSEPDMQNVIFTGMIFSAKKDLVHIPHICHFFYTIAIWGLEILHLKVPKFATKVASRQNSVK